MGRPVKKQLLLACFLIFNFLFLIFNFPARVLADVSCQPIYGGGQTCITTGNISINKTVLNPQTNKMVDNLGINDPKYQPNFIATFKIALTNTGNAIIAKINVKDVLPQHVNFTSGPGTFDDASKTLSFSVANLNPSETKTFVILGRIVEADKLPIDKGVICEVNQVVGLNADDSSQVSQDNAQFCIEKKVLAAQTPKQIPQTKGFPILTVSSLTTTPATGPEMLPLILLIPIGIIGYYFRKKAVKINRL